MTNKSQIELFQPEQKYNSDLQPIDPMSCPTIGNTFVVGSFVVPADFNDGFDNEECDDDGCFFCGDIYCGESCQDDEDF